MFSSALALTTALLWPAPLPKPRPDFCGLDAFESNDDRAHAVRVDGVAADGVVCAGDADWYSVFLRKGERVQVAVLHDREDRPEVPMVFAPRQRKAIGKPYEAEGELGIVLTAPAEGWFRVRVQGGGPAPLHYVLLVWPASVEGR